MPECADECLDSFVFTEDHGDLVYMCEKVANLAKGQRVTLALVSFHPLK